MDQALNSDSSHGTAGVGGAVRLVLGSASPGRARVLQQAGLDIAVQVSDVDEDAVVEAARARGEALSCSGTAQLLARAKADAVAGVVAEGAPQRRTLVLGCDSVFELDGAPYGKPYEVDVAVERWKQMRGKTGVLHSGHWMLDVPAAPAGRDGTDCAGAGVIVSTQVSFAEPTDAQIRAYAASGEPLQCAGAFTIDGRGAAFVRDVQGDPLSVIGVSPRAVAELLAAFDVDITDLWRTDAYSPSSDPSPDTGPPLAGHE